MSSTTQTHPAEHGILNGWTTEPKMAYFAMGHYYAIFATAMSDDSTGVTVTPADDAGVKTVAAAFRKDGRAVFIYYVPVDYDDTYVGKGYQPRTDAELTVSAADAPKNPVLVDLLRGGVYSVGSVILDGDRVTYTGLPLTDYPLALADSASVPKE